VGGGPEIQLTSARRFTGPENLPCFTLLGGLLYTLYTSRRADFLLESQPKPSHKSLIPNESQKPETTTHGPKRDDRDAKKV
jgi:hypothetical protein